MKKSLWLLPLLFSANAFGQALPVFNNVSAPLLSTPGAYALAGGGATAANMANFAPAAGAGAAVLVGTGALAVGTAVGYNLMGLVLGDGEDNVAVPLTNDPAKAVPAPEAPATSVAVYLYSASPSCPNYDPNSGNCYVNPGSCDQTTAKCSITMQIWCPAGMNCTAGPGSSETRFGPFVWDTLLYTNLSPNGTGCPSGYAGSGSCNLTDARLAQSDNRNDVARVGNEFVYPDDIDASNPDIPKGRIVTTNTPGDTLEVVGRSSSGNPLWIQARASPGGGSVVQLREQVQDANQNSFVKDRILEIAPDARVISDSQSIGPGSLTVPSVGESPLLNPSPVDSPAPYSNPATQQQPITFPTDYARQGEAAAAANAMTNALLAPSAAPGDPALPDGAQFDDAFFKNTFDGLKGWTVPNHVSSCPQPGFDWNGSSYTINTHCQLWTDHQSAIAAAMLVVWSIAALFIVLRA